MDVFIADLVAVIRLPMGWVIPCLALAVFFLIVLAVLDIFLPATIGPVPPVVLPHDADAAERQAAIDLIAEFRRQGGRTQDYLTVNGASDSPRVLPDRDAMREVALPWDLVDAEFRLRQYREQRVHSAMKAASDPPNLRLLRNEQHRVKADFTKEPASEWKGRAS